MHHATFRVRAIASTTLAYSLLAGSYAHAGLFGVSEEFQINTYTSAAQIQSTVTELATGDFAVVWTNSRNSTDFFRVGSIFGQRIDANGVKIGAEFPIGSKTYDSQPRVASAADGGFAVVWRRGFPRGYTDIVARFFDESGGPRGAEIFVSDKYTFANAPDAAFLTDGDLMVAWVEDDDLFLRRFAPDGASIGTEFRPVYLNGYGPRIAARSDGGFVVVWGPPRGEDSGDIYGRRFDGSGKGVGATFLVNSSTTGLHDRPSVSVAPSGSFVVAWTDYGQTLESRKAMARSFAADGTPQGFEFDVSFIPAGRSVMTSVAHSAGGGFVVSWSSVEAENDGSVYNIKARRFDASGTASGTEIQVNTFTPRQQTESTVAPSGAGSFVVVWGSYAQDGSDTGIFGRRIASGDVCGDPDESSTITANDALIQLRAAIGAQQCDPCICDVDDSGAVTVKDALIELQHSVGQDRDLRCHPCG